MEWLSSKIDAALAWIGELVKSVFVVVWDLITDICISIMDLFLTGIYNLIALIPTPEFMAGGLQSLLNGLPSSILYFLDRSGFAEAVALLGAGIAFRLLRKLFTLGQW